MMPKYNKDKSNNPIYPFRTPEGYFEDLKAKVLEEVKGRHQTAEVSGEGKYGLSTFKPYVYLAAMFVGIFLLFKGVSYFESDLSQQSSASIELSAAGQEEILFVSEEEVDAFIGHSADELAFQAEIFE